MTAQILDGRALAAGIRQQLKEKIAQHRQKPGLAVILAGNNPASEIYIRSKQKACREVGINAQTFLLPENVTEQELLSLIEQLNLNPEINGILVQLPLPTHLNEKNILENISPQKDVDGFHPYNAGGTLQKRPEAFTPCTPKGILRLLDATRCKLSGLNAVVVGRSQIVGMPTAHLLLNRNCTVTITHSHTRDLKALCRTADILVAAVGKAEFITQDCIKPGAIVIDVGINRTEHGLKGDVKFADALAVASYITPVPGGVGPMTIAMLLENTYEAFLKQQHS